MSKTDIAFFFPPILFFAVPPKPPHLQSPLRAEAQGHSPTAGSAPAQQARIESRSPSGGLEIVVLRASPGPSSAGSPSPARRQVNGLLGGVSPVRHARGIPTLSSSPPLASPSPGKRGLQSCSPTRDGGHSPAKLSPRHLSPLAARLRTPSPVLGRQGSYSPARSCKTRLGLHRGGKMDGQGKETAKSLSVPDLIGYLDETRLNFFSFFLYLFVCLFMHFGYLIFLTLLSVCFCCSQDSR